MCFEFVRASVRKQVTEHSVDRERAHPQPFDRRVSSCNCTSTPTRFPELLKKFLRSSLVVVHDRLPTNTLNEAIEGGKIQKEL